jgi:tetratricopeptide (TPR) repeat protein
MEPGVGRAGQDVSTLSEPSSTPAFIGRDAELRRLTAAFAEAQTGHRRLLLLAGDAGIGKTSLADELARQASATATVVWGRCWEGGGAPAYWPWTQILRDLTGHLDPSEVDRLAGPGAPALAELLFGRPGSAYGGDLGAEEGPSEERSRFSLFDGVTTLLSRLSAERPLVLIFDDLHAADRPSLLMLRFLARERREGRLLVIGTYRDVEAHRIGGVGDLMTGLAREGHVVRLSGLQVAHVRMFIRHATGADPSDPLVRLVHRTTEGNPFFLDEVVRLLDDELRSGRTPRLRIPDEVRETIRRRLAPLPGDVRDVLAVGATIGREFDVALLHTVCHIPTERLLDLLGEATAQEVLRTEPEHPGRFTFAHALIRDTLYEDLAPARRVQLHRRVGEALERLHDPDAFLPQLAHHFFQAVPGGNEKIAISYALRAGRQALAALAYEDALGHFERATEVAAKVAIGDALRCKLLLSMGDAQAKVGDPASARMTFERAAAVARGLGDAERLALAALGAGGLQVPTGVVDAQLDALLDEALAELGPDDSSLRGRLLARRAMGASFTASRDERDAMTAEAVAIARRLEDRGVLAYALNARCFALWAPDDERLRLETGSEIVRLARQAGDAELALEGHAWRIVALLESGDIAAADAEIKRYARVAAERQQPASLWQAEVMRAMRALLDGSLDEAERLAAQAFSIAQRDPEPATADGSGTRLGPNAALAYASQVFNVRTHQGRLHEMEDTVRALAHEYPTLPVWRCALAYLLCDGPDRSFEARTLFDQLASKHFEDLPVDGYWLVAMALLAEIAAYLGDANRARLLYDLLRPYAGRQVVVGRALVCRGAVSHYVGLLAATMGRTADADAAFAAALELHERLGARVYAARTRRDWGRTLITRRDKEHADAGRQHLEQALAAFTALGLERPAEPIRALLAEIGPRPVSRPAPRPGPQPTTASLSNEGEYWTITFDGRTSRLRDTKGLRYLAALLVRPDREVHAIDLAGGSTADLGDAGAALDADARRAYERRIADLQEEIEEAGRYGDPERAAKAESERDFILGQLSAGLGLSGRDRMAASHAERARLNVTRAIRTTLQRVEAADPGLARHLGATIRTGAFCSYTPDPRAPVAWRIVPR